MLFERANIYVRAPRRQRRVSFPPNAHVPRAAPTVATGRGGTSCWSRRPAEGPRALAGKGTPPGRGSTAGKRQHARAGGSGSSRSRRGPGDRARRSGAELRPWASASSSPRGGWRHGNNRARPPPGSRLGSPSAASRASLGRGRAAAEAARRLGLVRAPQRRKSSLGCSPLDPGGPQVRRLPVKTRRANLGTIDLTNLPAGPPTFLV